MNVTSHYSSSSLASRCGQRGGVGASFVYMYNIEDRTVPYPLAIFI
jgi:hypothetical protein